MALTVTHALVSAIADDPVAAAAGEVVPSDWNADHTIAVTSLTIATGTITASEPVLDLSQTWNNAAVTFTGVKLNVTNTASAAASLLQDWQVGGVSKASITVAGRIASGCGYSYGSPQFYDSGIGSGSGFQIKDPTEVVLVADGGAGLAVQYGGSGNGVRISGSIPFGFVNGHALNGTSDVRLWRDDAAILALRNSTNAQTFRVYGTYTDSSNYVRASLASSSTAVTLAAETAGTGADNVNINITPAGTGSVVITNSLSIDGTTNSYPRIIRSGNSLGCELADGSDYCSVSGGGFYAKGGGLHEVAVIRGSGLKLGAANNIRWSSTSSYGGTPDLFIERDAAAVLAQRNDTTAQTLRVYGTYTDSSNYVRASLASSSTAVTLAAETAGTGADNVPVNLTPAGTEGVVIGNFAQFTEMTAPAAGAANTARLFCEDNGSGKTRLMVQFASGAAQQIAIEP